MSTINAVGIIAEYNPYHNGHLYQMSEAQNYSNADFCIAVMSGHFVQRGEPAIYDTYTRARMALMSGADAVFEIPAPFSTASAEDFASYGVSLLASLGVSYISFGTENASYNELKDIAQVLLDESDTYKFYLKEGLKNGLSYPVSRLNAVMADMTCKGIDDISVLRAKNILSTPNNILGIEYVKAMLRYRSPLKSITVTRKDNSYHDKNLNIGLSSATAIREHILKHIDDTHILKDAVPEDTYDILLSAQPISADDFTGTIIRKIIDSIYNGPSLDIYSDISSDLADRINSAMHYCSSYQELVNMIKTKQYTYTRISRALIHILLGITDRKMSNYKTGRLAPYARLVGFRRESADLLSQLKANSSIPIISKMANAGDILKDDDNAFALLMDEAYASEIYNSIYYDKYHIELPNLYTRQMVII